MRQPRDSTAAVSGASITQTKRPRTVVPVAFFQARVPMPVYRALVRAAEARGVSRNKFITDAIAAAAAPEVEGAES